MRVDPSYAMLCPNGACHIIMFWNNIVTKGMCPFCGTLGDFVAGATTTSEPRVIEIEVREHSVGRSRQREVDGGRRPLYEDVQLPERVCDHDSQEEG
jgi:hypothetical protein